MAFNQDVKGVVANPAVHPRFLAHWFVANAHELLGLATASTHGTKKIDLPDLLKFPVRLPPASEQHGIAEVVDAVDDAIGATEAAIAKLKLSRLGLLDDFIAAVGGPHLTVAELAVQDRGATTIGPFGSNLLASDYRPSGVPVVFVRDVKASGFVWNSNV